MALTSFLAGLAYVPLTGIVVYAVGEGPLAKHLSEMAFYFYGMVTGVVVVYFGGVVVDDRNRMGSGMPPGDTRREIEPNAQEGFGIERDTHARRT